LTVVGLDGSAPDPLTGLASREESFGAWLPDGRLLVGIDYPESLRGIRCGEGQLDWLP
jgi:hypothetical protein